MPLLRNSAWRTAAGTRDLSALQLATHRRELALRLAAGGRAIDGAAVLAAAVGARAAGQAPSDAFVARGVPVAGDEAALDALADELIAMFGERFVSQPAPADIEAWVPDRLEHDFSLAVPDDAQRATTLVAHEYTGGHLDWYAFDASRPQRVPEVRGPRATHRILRADTGALCRRASAALLGVRGQPRRLRPDHRK